MAETMTNEQATPSDSVVLNFETLASKPREFARINGREYLLADYDSLSFRQLAEIERRRRIVQAFLTTPDAPPDAEAAADRALREVVEYLIPDAARDQVMWTPRATTEEPDPQPRPVKMTDTLGARERLSILNLFTDPSAADAIRALALRLLRANGASSTSDTSPPDSPQPTDPLPSPAGIG